MERVTAAGKRKALSIAQIVIAALVLVAVVWLGYKLFVYGQSQSIYHEMQAAYASDISDDDPSSVNFEAIGESHSNVVGWLKMDDVDISYPIMHGTDNEHYLHYDPDENPNFDGSIFLDYRNHSFEKDLHVLVYGHNMLDESMFGQLDEYVSEDFYRKGTGAFTIFTPEGSYRYKIFAADIVSPTDEAYQVGYKNTQVFDAFVKRLKENSMYDTGVDVSGSDHVVTLSTCSADDRLVLSAKRVEQARKQ